MSLTGDFAKIKSWSKLLDDSGKMLPIMSEAMSAEFIRLAERGFDQERDPYGKPWKAKKRPDGRKVLSGPSGALKAGFRSKISKRGFKVTNIAKSEKGFAYFAAHQSPREGKRPMRAMLPKSSRGLPKAWRAELSSVCKEICKAYFVAHPMLRPEKRQSNSISGGIASHTRRRGRRRGLTSGRGIRLLKRALKFAIAHTGVARVAHGHARAAAN